MGSPSARSRSAHKKRIEKRKIGKKKQKKRRVRKSLAKSKVIANEACSLGFLLAGRQHNAPLPMSLPPIIRLLLALLPFMALIYVSQLLDL